MLGEGRQPVDVAAALSGTQGRALAAPAESNAVARLITLDPAHFHAALVQKEMLEGMARRAAVFAPLGPDVLEYLKLIEQFNHRPEHPTNWELDVHLSPCSLEELLAARPGNVVVLAGHNRRKIQKITASLDAGLNVLADKPWIIRREDLPLLESALALAQQRGLVAYDMMTERHEITTILQRELVNDPDVLGAPLAGGEAPAVLMESVHHILKRVAGAPVLRPPSFFDVEGQGGGLADVGTHLADLVAWMLFPGRALRWRDDIQVQECRHWITPLTLADFHQVTGLPAFPPELARYVHDGRLDYDCNNQVDYTICGVRIRLCVEWHWESPANVDLHHALFRGTKAHAEVRQGEREHYRPELFIAPNRAADFPTWRPALARALARLESTYPGLGLEAREGEMQVTIPDRYRVGHEALFAQVVSEFLGLMRAPASLPAWDWANMLAKYYVTTSCQRSGRPSSRS